MPSARPLVLVVEDSALVALEMEQLVEECGCAVLGPVGNLGAAFAAIDDVTPAAAVLDVNLGTERIWPLASHLADRAVPFLFLTGYTAGEMPAGFRDRMILSKPVAPIALGGALRALGIFRG